MQVHHLDDIVHLLVLRQFHLLEDTGDHARAEVVMVAEGPSRLRVVGFGAWFADVVEQCRPTKP